MDTVLKGEKKKKKNRKREEEAKSWIRNLFFDELENTRYLHEIARAIIIIVSVLKLKCVCVKREHFSFFFFLHNKNIKISYRTDLSIPFKKIVGNKRKRVQKFTDIGVPFNNFPCIPRVKYSMRLKYKRFTTRRDI